MRNEALRRSALSAGLFALVACGSGAKTQDTGAPPADGGGAPEAAPPAGSFTSLGLLAGQRGGLGNVDGAGSDARFARPWYTADDGQGHLFLTDGDSVRTLDEATGVVTTLAGIAFSVGPMTGFVDGAGPDARFDSPSGLAVDTASGVVYVADSGNSAIRTVDAASGATATIVHPSDVPGSGGAVVPRFTPVGLALDGAGHLYVADFGNVPTSSPAGGETGGAIYEVSLAGGGITLVAGAPAYAPTIVDGAGAAARFGHLRGLVFDGQGALYAADGCAVRRIDVASAAVTTLAANACVDRLYGLAFDGAGTLYAADGASVIRAVTMATGSATTVAGQPHAPGAVDGAGAGATFGGPTGVAVSGGILRIADTGNVTLRAMTTSGAVVTTVAGLPPAADAVDAVGTRARFDAPQGAAFDGAGMLYVVDWNDDTIRALDVASGAVTTLAGTPGVSGRADGTGPVASFYEPTWLAYDGAGALYVSDTGNSAVRRIDVATRAVTTVTAGGMVPQGLAIDGAGNLYVVDAGFSTILRIDPKSGATSAFAGARSRTCGTSDGVGAAAGFCGPQGLTWDGASSLYVTDNQTVRRIDLATAQVTTIAGSPGVTGSADGVGAAALFDDPSALASDGAGNLYVADSFNATVRRIDLATGRVTTEIGHAGQYGVVLGPIGGARLNGPEGLAAGPGGTLFVTDIDENVVLQAR